MGRELARAHFKILTVDEFVLTIALLEPTQTNETCNGFVDALA
jgi:hypothetical protein